jgi:hypothetical protein
LTIARDLICTRMTERHGKMRFLWQKGVCFSIGVP